VAQTPRWTEPAKFYISTGYIETICLSWWWERCAGNM